MSGLPAAFITGGSSGIGLELAKQLAEFGHPIALFARDAGRLQDVIRVLKSEFPEIIVTAHPVDVSDRAALDSATAAAIATHGAPGWAIANAGIAKPGEFLTQDLDSFEAQMQTNYMGALYFAKALAPADDRQGRQAGFYIVRGGVFRHLRLRGLCPSQIRHARPGRGSAGRAQAA